MTGERTGRGCPLQSKVAVGNPARSSGGSVGMIGSLRIGGCRGGTGAAVELRPVRPTVERRSGRSLRTNAAGRSDEGRWYRASLPRKDEPPLRCMRCSACSPEPSTALANVEMEPMGGEDAVEGGPDRDRLNASNPSSRLRETPAKATSSEDARAAQETLNKEMHRQETQNSVVDVDMSFAVKTSI